MQVCKYATIQVFEYASIKVCKYRSIRVCNWPFKNGLTLKRQKKKRRSVLRYTTRQWLARNLVLGSLVDMEYLPNSLLALKIKIVEGRTHSPPLTLAKTVQKSYLIDTWVLFHSYIGHICIKYCIYLENISPTYHQN